MRAVWGALLVVGRWAPTGASLRFLESPAPAPPLTRAPRRAQQSEGADPSIRTEDFDPYLDPGRKLPYEVAVEDDAIRAKIRALDAKYAGTPKKAEPNPDIGCWWALYDYGLDAVKAWPRDYKHPYPGARRRGGLGDSALF